LIIGLVLVCTIFFVSLLLANNLRRKENKKERQKRQTVYSTEIEFRSDEASHSAIDIGESVRNQAVYLKVDASSMEQDKLAAAINCNFDA
jgi:hypothetical protein